MFQRRAFSHIIFEDMQFKSVDFMLICETFYGKGHFELHLILLNATVLVYKYCNSSYLDVSTVLHSVFPW